MATTIQQIELPKKARAVDTSGNNNHGQIYSGRGLEFDGITDYLDLGSNITVSTGAWTVACWVNTANAAGSVPDNIIGVASNLSAAYLGISDSLNLAIYDWGGTSWRESDTSMELNTWYRAVFSYDGSGTLTFYLNGVADGEVAIGTSGDDDDLLVRYIGCLSNQSRFFDGLMSDVQLWDTAWSAADVTYDYLNPESLALNNSGTALTESNLKLWYPMQDGHRGQQSYILDGSNSGLGEELVANGTFDNDISSWTDYAPSTTIATYDNGGLKIVGSGGHGRMTQEVTGLESGVLYRLSIDVVSTTGNNFVHLGTAIGGAQIVANLSQGGGVGTFTFNFTSTQTTAHIQLGAILDHTVVYDNVSIKAINDKHHATTVFYGDELVTNGDFADNTPSDTWDGSAQANLSGTWTALGTHTSANHFNIVGGECRARHDGGTASGIGNTTLLTIGRTYTVSLEIISVASGAIKVYIGGNSTSFSTPGIKTITDVASSASFSIYRSGACDIIFDDVTVKEVGVATGWTDADQQLHIPQTALQSYNELAWFDGTIASNGYVDLDTQIATTNNNWSLSFWMFRLDTGASYSFIFGQNDNEKIIAVDNNGNEKLSYRETGGAYHTLSNAVLPYGEWIHVVITATADTSMTAYIDGVAQTTNSDMSDTELVLDWIMRGYQNANYNILGSVNEISYYNDVLTAAEALDLFNDGKAKSALEASGSAGLVGYWRNNGLSEWKDLKGSNDGNTTAGVTETILIPQGVDSTRDAQGFIMNKQKDTSCLNLTNGSDEPYIDLGSVTTVADDEAFSFSAWLKPDTLTDNYFIGNGSTDHIRIHSATAIKFKANGDTVEFDVGDGDMVIKEWFHLALVRAADDTISVYIDSVLNGSAGTNTQSSNHPFDYRYLGARLGDSISFTGQIDGILIYDSELSAAEVLRNYNATKGSHRN